MTVPGVLRIPLRRYEDERGWFCELRRDSALPRPTVQTNLSFSRKGVIRGLHYHERGQDDLFVCLQGTARVVVLDRNLICDLIAHFVRCCQLGLVNPLRDDEGARLTFQYYLTIALRADSDQSVAVHAPLHRGEVADKPVIVVPPFRQVLPARKVLTIW